MNDRFKFRVWNKNTHSFTTGGAIKFGGLCFVDEEDFGIKLGEHQECYIIEQCTGLKDKNGNLIYESDYVKANDVIYRVFWNKTKISLANILNGDIIDMSETITMEIVGNEHEKDNISEIPKNTERRFN